MARAPHFLRLYLLDERSVDLDAVGLLIDRLAGRRAVSGGAPEWRVVYEAEDPTEAMSMCAADLDQLDPRWVEVLDFTAARQPARPSPVRRS